MGGGGLVITQKKDYNPYGWKQRATVEQDEKADRRHRDDLNRRNQRAEQDFRLKTLREKKGNEEEKPQHPNFFQQEGNEGYLEDKKQDELKLLKKNSLDPMELGVSAKAKPWYARTELERKSRMLVDADNQGKEDGAKLSMDPLANFAEYTHSRQNKNKRDEQDTSRHLNAVERDVDRPHHSKHHHHHDSGDGHRVKRASNDRHVDNKRARVDEDMLTKLRREKEERERRERARSNVVLLEAKLKGSSSSTAPAPTTT